MYQYPRPEVVREPTGAGAPENAKAGAQGISALGAHCHTAENAFPYMVIGPAVPAAPAQAAILAEGVHQIVSVNRGSFHADYHTWLKTAEKPIAIYGYLLPLPRNPNLNFL